MFMFDRVYRNEMSKSEDSKAQKLIISLYEYYRKHIEEIPKEYFQMMEQFGETKERVICDYIAGMTDGYAIKTFEILFIPKSWKK